MGNPVSLAFIGVGAHANYAHYPSLAEMEDVQVVAVCDLSPERASATAQRWNIPRTYTDYRQMLKEVEPQAVYVIMPPHQMFDIVADVLSRRLHVFIEKPPGITVEQTRNLARLAEKNGCLTMVGFQRRFVPMVVQARRKVEERGAITQCLARFESGAVGILLTNWVTGRRIYSVEMHAYNISAYAEPDDRALIYRDGSLEPEVIRNTEAAGSNAPHRYLGFFDENRHFIDCIKSEQQPQTCFADAVKTMEMVEKIAHERL